MDVEALSSCLGRAVILSSDRSLAESCRASSLQCAIVGSAYEAAAELLAAPTVALIVDLRLLTAKHLRLLEIARQMGMEMFGVGAICGAMTADQLSGLRLVSRSDLPDAIKAVVDAELSQLQTPVEILPLLPHAAEAPVETPEPQKPAPGARLTPAKPAETGPGDDQTFLSDTAIPPTDDVEPLLTREEIDALLGGER